MTDTITIQATEDLLVHGLQQKSAQALNVLYERYSGALYGVICRIVNDDHIAEDILQEAFVKIWNNAESYDKSKGRLFTWMLNICRNASIDKMRSKGYKSKKKTSGEEAIDHQADNNLYNDIRPETIGIKEIVNKLKPEWKVIVDLIYFNGYTHQEVSEELNIPLGTVKTRLRSAILFLRGIV
ncbi:MAG: sigma-70 family RNA polymerase sigma factor [Fimbriimonadaceae bacterium]|nr:sigma-70 family RNA polymerase sigma factor [Chitinophagales bacterium]